MFYRSVWSARNPSLALVPEDRDQGTLRSAAVSYTEQTGLKKVKLKNPAVNAAKSPQRFAGSPESQITSGTACDT